MSDEQNTERQYSMAPPALLSSPNNLVPEGADVQEIVTRDRVLLRTASWQPTDNLDREGQPVGTICLFQGFSECIEKYYEVITELRQRGFVVATLDWRGQGLSHRQFKGRKRGHVRSFKLYQRDLDAFIKIIVLPHCPPPYYALAHSMGGHNLFAAATGPQTEIFNRILLSAPMLHLSPRNLIGFHWLRRGRSVLSNQVVSQRPTRLLTGLMRKLGLGWTYVPGSSKEIISTFDGNLLTSDEKRFDRTNELYTAHPELAIAASTVSWLNSACRSMRKILKPKFIRRINVPILIVAAGLDQVVSTPAIEKVGPMMRVGRHVVIRGARHEILQERDEIRSQFWAAFDAFIPGSDPMRSRSKPTRHKGL